MPSALASPQDGPVYFSVVEIHVDTERFVESAELMLTCPLDVSVKHMTMELMCESSIALIPVI
jgi:hypothetical protein